MKKQILDKIENINQKLEENFLCFGDVEDKIKESMLYSVKAGGKRLRPLLFQVTFEEFNKGSFELSDVFSFVLALEYIHTYSLIHDDLPAMDNDDLRRGQPTNHIVYGEDMAILAGDGLLNFAMETITKAILLKSYTKEEYIRFFKALDILFSASGSSGMIKGQVLDIKAKENDTLKYLEDIHTNKTGKLFLASIYTAAILADADESVLHCLEDLSHKLGLAFQIQDDLIDCLKTSEELGKPAGSDEKNNKLTYVSVLGVEKSMKVFNNTKEEIKAIILKLGKENTVFEDLIFMAIKEF
ncbi:MAG: polyprenyl synthetase family protein [Lachnospirales bacterium]